MVSEVLIHHGWEAMGDQNSSHQGGQETEKRGIWEVAGKDVDSKDTTPVICFL
jgi:hypothetical protein